MEAEGATTVTSVRAKYLAYKICAPGKPGSMGKEVAGDPWKFEIGTQQVQVLPS
jgi:hypothetical protein